jgi:pSer/pThr/pTyr-binding forkhead associated (FHA) protein
MILELVNADRQKPSIVLDQFPVIVGLDPGADICLDDSSVGHYQCMIDRSEGLLTVWDLGTKQGTTINGVRISRTAPLRPGDELGIGRNRFVAHYDSGSAKPLKPAEPSAANGSRPRAAAHRRREPVGQV